MSEQTPRELIERVRELSEAATPGPWINNRADDRYGRSDDERGCYVWRSSGPGYGAIAHLTGPNYYESTVAENARNAALIAEFRTAAPILADALDVAVKALYAIALEDHLSDWARAKADAALRALGDGQEARE